MKSISQIDDLLQKFKRGNDVASLQKAVETINANNDELREELKLDRRGEKTKLHPELRAELEAEGRISTKVAPPIVAAAYVQDLYLANKKNPDRRAQERLLLYDKISTKAAMQEDTASEGGYTVPTIVETGLMSLAEGASVALPLMTPIQMVSKTHNIPAIDADGNGVSVTFSDEEDPITESEPTIKSVTLTAKRCDAYAIASNELLEDTTVGGGIYMLLDSQFSEAIAQKIDSAVFVGDGDPFSGIFTGAVGNSVVFGAGSTAFSEIMECAPDNLIDLLCSVESYAQKRPQFFMHLDVLKYILKSKDDQSRHYFDPTGSFPSFYGREMRVSHKCPSTSAADTALVAYGDLSHIAFGRRSGLTILVDPYSNSLTWQTNFVFVQRMAFAYIYSAALSRLMTASG
jgi:HK97 family phage major capsid protein